MARALKPKTDFAARLIEARIPVERDEFATLLGVPKGTLAGYERGERFPPPEVLRAIRRQTGVSLDWLIAGEGEMRPSEDLPLPPLESVPVAQPRQGYNRALMHTLIALYIEQALELQTNFTPNELADKVLAMYDRSIDEINAMAAPAAKIA